MPEIRYIPAVGAPENAKLPVAAYCRVSSDSDDQLNSLSAQVREYTKQITAEPDWEFAGIYADEGITGTSTKKRNEFKRLMRDCEAGKVKRVLVKSVSRFARNTTDCLQYLRQLSALGVTVYFEKEGIDTAKMSSDVILTMTGAFAQEESNALSTNIRWSYQKRMQAGMFVGNIAPYGYDWKNGTLIINEAEARIVRWIFHSYLDGLNRAEIAAQLNAMQNEPSNRPIWYKTTVNYILANERYIGDALLQKKYTVQGTIGLEKRNHGEMPQYYVEDTHPAIISEDTFRRAQAMRIRQTTYLGPHIGSHIFQKRIRCAECGRTLRRKPRKSGLVSWVCLSHDENKALCPTPPIFESNIEKAAIMMYRILRFGIKDILHPMLYQLEQLQGRTVSDSTAINELNQSIASLSEQRHMLNRLLSKGFMEPDTCQAQVNAISQQLADLNRRRRSLIEAQVEDDAIENTQLLIDILEDAPENLVSLEDGGVFDMIVDKVIIDKDKNITFRLINGLELGGDFDG